MNIEITSAAPGDVGEIIELVREFAAYENLTDYCTVTEEQLSGVLFGPGAFVRALVARSGEPEIAGYALYYPNFASFRGQRGMYLEDIYVGERYRGKRVGRALLRAVARSARKAGCCRIDFQVLDWNRSAIDFYFAQGAQRDDEERHFKFVDDAFVRLASEK
jgi:GNAT superfamily N-acetyltransferase